MRIKAVEGIKAYNHGSDLGAVSVRPSVRWSVGRVGWLVRRSTSLDLRLSVCIPVRESELLHGYRLSAQPTFPLLLALTSGSLQKLFDGGKLHPLRPRGMGIKTVFKTIKG